MPSHLLSYAHTYIHTYIHLPAYITFGSSDFSSANIQPCSCPPPPPVHLWSSIAHRVISLVHYYLLEAMYVCKTVRIGACSRRRQLSCPALSIAAPRQRALYPMLHFSTLPYPALLSSSICVSVFLSYVFLICPLSVSYSLSYCRWGGRPSIMQPVWARLRPVRSSSSRERTSPPRTM